MQRIIHENGVITYTFDQYSSLPVQTHVSTRHGGVSPAPWNTLNFSVSRGDTPERVAMNRMRFSEAVGVNNGDRVHCHQVHGTGVAKVGWGDAGESQAATDALITDEIGLPLSLVFADCVPIVLYDSVRHVLGACHAGWRGTVNGTATATLWAMQAAYSTQPADVWVGIGPSIGQESYEVGQEVVDLAQAKFNDPMQFFTYPQGQDAKPHFNLWQANAVQLNEAGVPLAQIEISGIDTAQNTQDFFSHRAEKGQCGLFGMMAWLTER